MNNPSTSNQTLRQLAIDAAAKAYSPYSQACVGAAVETLDGTLFSGCNVENASYGATVCAERVAIWQAVAAGHTKIKALYVYSNNGWPPCGMCRQVMVEFGDPTMRVIIGNKSGDQEETTLEQLVPLSFSSLHLEEK